MQDAHEEAIGPAVTGSSRFGYAETVQRLTAAIAAAGNTLFAQIDQRDEAQKVGLQLRPTTLLIFGNPKGGTPLMDAFPLVALDLPLKIVVWEDANCTFVAYTPMATLANRYAITGQDARITAIGRTLETIVAAVV